MKVEDEWDRDPEAVDLHDLLFLTYDPEQVSLEKLQTTIHNEGFEADFK